MNIVFFDYDDSLLPTTFLFQHGYKLDKNNQFPPISDELKPKLQSLEKVILEFLSNLVKTKCQICIVTNSEQGWLSLSAAHFLPGLLTFLQEHSINIIYAKDEHSYHFTNPEDVSKWKQLSFENEIKSLILKNLTSKTNTIGNVISFGDSLNDRTSIQDATQKYNGVLFCKSIKFHEQADVLQLENQIILIQKNFDLIFKHKADLDLKMTVVTS